MITAQQLCQEQSATAPFAAAPPLCAYCERACVLAQATYIVWWHFVEDREARERRRTAVCDHHADHLDMCAVVVAVEAVRR